MTNSSYERRSVSWGDGDGSTVTLPAEVPDLLAYEVVPADAVLVVGPEGAALYADDYHDEVPC